MSKELMDESTPPEVDRLRAVVAGVRAPAALRAQLEADRERLAFRRGLWRRFQLTGALAGAAAVAGAVIALLVPGGAPTALEAAALGARPAEAAAPAVDPAQPQVLRAEVGGVRFPTWGPELRWTAAGARSDELEGRTARTVFYDSPDGVRLGYTIVDGEALPWPEGGRTVERDGVRVHLARDGDRRVAVWRVGGRTCVMSAPASVPEDRLVALASVSTYG